MQNYFELFDLPISFTVDIDTLASRYRKLQQSVHPDKYVNASEQERRLSIQHAARINDAYHALKDPLKRAQYLLELNGVQEGDAAMDNAFLMQQMELRESLEDVRSQADPLLAIGQILDEVADLIRQNSQLLNDLLVSEDQEGLEKAKNQVRKMQFLSKMAAEAESLEAELEDAL